MVQVCHLLWPPFLFAALSPAGQDDPGPGLGDDPQPAVFLRPPANPGRGRIGLEMEMAGCQPMMRDRVPVAAVGRVDLHGEPGTEHAGEMIERRLEALGILDLERLLHAGSDDLPASRSGAMSAEQRRRLQARADEVTGGDLEVLLARPDHLFRVALLDLLAERKSCVPVSSPSPLTPIPPPARDQNELRPRFESWECDGRDPEVISPGRELPRFAPGPQGVNAGPEGSPCLAPRPRARLPGPSPRGHRRGPRLRASA